MAVLPAKLELPRIYLSIIQYTAVFQQKIDCRAYCIFKNSTRLPGIQAQQCLFKKQTGGFYMTVNRYLNQNQMKKT